MSQTAHKNLESGIGAGVYYLLLFPVSSRFTNVYKIDGDKTQPARTQPSQGESNFGDSSGSFFSIYFNAAEEEDNKVDRWQKNIDDILVFVSPLVSIHADLCINWSTIDRSIL